MIKLNINKLINNKNFFFYYFFLPKQEDEEGKCDFPIHKKRVKNQPGGLM